MARKYSNTAVETTLTNTITAGALSMDVGSVSGFPVTFPYYLIIDHESASKEVVSVSAAAGTTLTIARGQGGTAASGHNAGTSVIHGVTAEDLSEPQTHIDASTNVHGLAGGAAVVGTTSTQTLTNKTMSGAANTFSNIPTTAISGTGTLTIEDLSVTDDASVAGDLSVTGLFTSPGYRLSEIVDFTADGSFTKANYSGLRMVIVESQGGGGAGGGAAATGVGESSVGGGGRGGGWALKTILAASLAASETVTVGDGGTGASGTTGGDGEESSFGTHCTGAGGGGGGTLATGSAAGRIVGGDGTVGSNTGDRTIQGGDGGFGLRISGTVAVAGSGGMSVLGAGPRGSDTSGAGSTGLGRGGGGSGAANGASQSARSGGNGAAGRVLVYVYV